MGRYKILKLKATKIIKYRSAIENEGYIVDLNNEMVYGLVVDEQLVMEGCALFDQMRYELKIGNEEKSDCLIHEIVIVDFADFYKKKNSISKDKIKQLIDKGFKIRFDK